MARDDVPSPLAAMDLPSLADRPLVSVIVSNFNYAHFLTDAIDSVLRQSYPHFEIIICDDGSTDESQAVIRRLQCRDQRVRSICQANAGQAAAWNRAIGASYGEILCFLDPDDLFVDGKLAAVVDAFMLHPTAGLCLHRLQAMTTSGRPINQPFPHMLDSGWIAETALRDDFWGSWPATSGVSLRREVAERMLPLPPALRRGFSDAYICGCAQFVTRIVALDDPLALYRLHTTNTSSAPRLTLEVVAYRVDYTALTVDGIRGFVERAIGASAAGQISLNRLGNRWFWENWLILYVVDRQFRARAQHANLTAAIKHVSPSWRRLAWRSLLLLPPTVARRLLSLWWGHRPWKRLIRQLPMMNSPRVKSRFNVSI